MYKINFELNGIKCKGLWDTGSIVSLVSRAWLEKEDIVGDRGGIDLRAANNSNVTVDGVVVADFQIPNTIDLNIAVPFLVTNNQIDLPVVGL